jgi:hypothetical protein
VTSTQFHWHRRRAQYYSNPSNGQPPASSLANFPLNNEARGPPTPSTEVTASTSRNSNYSASTADPGPRPSPPAIQKSASMDPTSHSHPAVIPSESLQGTRDRTRPYRSGSSSLVAPPKVVNWKYKRVHEVKVSMHPYYDAIPACTIQEMLDELAVCPSQDGVDNLYRLEARAIDHFPTSYREFSSKHCLECWEQCVIFQ